MPELPEVETVRRSLLDHVVGRTILGLRPGDFPGVVGEEAIADVSARLAGRRIAGIRRRGKYLFFDLDDESVLLVHLRMTGQLLLTERAAPPVRFERLAIELDDGRDVRFADQRKFGRVLHLLPAQAATIEQGIGPEPLGTAFTAADLAERLRRRTGKLKSVLLDQRLVAGLGNIYVDEALFRARLHPERAANSLSAEEIGRLRDAIQMVLREGLTHRGTTLSHFADAEGAHGANQHNLRVYGHGGREPCPRCGAPLQRIVVGGRGTHFCPVCQPLNPPRSAPGPPARPAG